jgi:hypothetical protein
MQQEELEGFYRGFYRGVIPMAASKWIIHAFLRENKYVII